MMYLKSTIWIWILVTLFTTVLSCSCIQTSFKDRFCRSSLVVRARVVARFDNCPGTCDPADDQDEGKITYIVRVMRTFKGEKPEDDVLFLDTDVNGGLCGVVLDIGTSYLFTPSAPFVPNTLPGLPVEQDSCPVGSLGINLCDFTRPWKSLTKQERMFLFRNSKNGNQACA